MQSPTRPDDERLKNKIDELRKHIRQLRRYNGKQLIHQINIVNSKIIGIGNYYKPATMVNFELSKHASSLNFTASKALKGKGGKLTPANKVSNLINRHKEYETEIPAIQAEEITVGVTNLNFVRWEKAYLKNPKETPYTPEGRTAYYKRTSKVQAKARDDITMSLTTSELISKGMTQPVYNFEYLMNRAYAFNRDKSKCRVCSEPIAGYELETHHIDPGLPIEKVNKVPNLASTHRNCHKLIHSKADVSQMVNKKVSKKILIFRERLSLKLEVV